MFVLNKIYDVDGDDFPMLVTMSRNKETLMLIVERLKFEKEQVLLAQLYFQNNTYQNWLKKNPSPPEYSLIVCREQDKLNKMYQEYYQWLSRRNIFTMEFGVESTLEHVEYEIVEVEEI